MNRKLLAGMVALSIWGFTALDARAQDPVFSELYGRGVHAYNSHRYEEAHTQLSAAIDQGSRDPRVYIYRGLAYSKLGRPEQAAADFRNGAMLELQNTDQAFDIGKALERVQGTQRLAIEKYRREARVTVARQQADAAQARYEKTQANDERVIRRPNVVVDPAPVAPMPAVPIAPDVPMKVETPAPPPAPPMPPVANDPFGGGVGVGTAEKVPDKVVPPMAEAPPAADPFAPAVPATKPAVADPFDPATKPMAPAAEVDPAAPKPATPMTPAEAPDPFGGTPAPAAPATPAKNDDPFGGAAASPPATGGGAEKSSVFRSLFRAAGSVLPPLPTIPVPPPPRLPMAPPARPATTPPATTQPAAPPMKPATDDPFGGPATEKPAPAAPAADDPFGPATPAAPKPAAPPPAADPIAESPAKPAAPPPAASDPFTDPPAKPATPPPPPANDPFGDTAPAPAPAPAPASPPPASPAPPPAPAPSDDPFGA